MLHIVLLVLKIIGYVLLAILALILLLILEILFIPFVYSAKGEKNSDEISINAKIAWLFNLLRFKISFHEKKPLVKGYFIFFKIFDSSKNKKETNKEKSEKINKEQSEEAEPKKSGLKNFIEHKDDFDLDEIKQLLAVTLNNVGKLLKHILPRKIKATVKYSAGSPDLTGYILGVWSMLYPFFYDKVFVDGDFDADAFIEFNGRLRGHFFGITVLILVIKIALNKDMLKFINKLKREDATNGKSAE